jgi:hypothetical protein
VEVVVQAAALAAVAVVPGDAMTIFLYSTICFLIS